MNHNDELRGVQNAIRGEYTFTQVGARWAMLLDPNTPPEVPPPQNAPTASLLAFVRSSSPSTPSMPHIPPNQLLALAPS